MSRLFLLEQLKTTQNSYYVKHTAPRIRELTCFGGKSTGAYLFHRESAGRIQGELDQSASHGFLLFAVESAIEKRADI